MTKLKARPLCPTCRAKFDAPRVHKLFLEVRDNRVRKLKQLLKPQTNKSVVDDGVTEAPSSSRAGTPSLSQFENEDESYGDEVQEQAALCAHVVRELKLGTSPGVVSGASAEIMKVVDQMNHRPGDNIEVGHDFSKV
jgi:hypothetical protein